MKYINAEKLIAEIERRIEEIKSTKPKFGPFWLGQRGALDCVLEEIIPSLQQEQQETEMKSPFTGGKVTILSRQEEVTFRGEKVKILQKYYRCEDTGREFTDSKLDDDMMWAAFRAYSEKKGMTSFTDIMLKQAQPEVDVVSTAKVFLDALSKTPYNNKPITDAQIIVRQLLLFFENPKEYNPDAILEQPEVDLEKEMKEPEQGWYNEAAKYWSEHCELNKAKDQRILILDAPTFTELVHEFYELGLNARKEE